MSQYTENPSDKPAPPGNGDQGELPPPQVTLPPAHPRHSLAITLVASAIVAALVAAVLTLGIQAIRGNLARSQTLIQEGRLTVNQNQSEGVEVYYPIPYASPPHLTLVNGAAYAVIVEQKPDHFKIRAAGTTVNADVNWKAEGVPDRSK